MPNKHKWDVTERHFLHIARTETDLSPTDIERVFAQTFSGGFWPEGLPNATRLTDEYNCRYNSGRSQHWANHVERTSYDQTQQRDRQQARDRIRAAAATLGISVNWTPLPQSSVAASSASTPPALVPAVPARSASATRPPRHPAASTSSRATPDNTNKRKRTEREPCEPFSIFRGGTGEKKPAKATTADPGLGRAATHMDAQEEDDNGEAPASPLPKEDRTAQTSAADDRHQVPTRNTRPTRRTRSTAAVFKDISDDEEDETPIFVQPKHHNGPTFAQIYEKQSRTNPLHPAYRRPQKQEIHISVEWNDRLDAALDGMKVLNADLRRRLAQQLTFPHPGEGVTETKVNGKMGRGEAEEDAIEVEGND